MRAGVEFLAIFIYMYVAAFKRCDIFLFFVLVLCVFFRVSSACVFAERGSTAGWAVRVFLKAYLLDTVNARTGTRGLEGARTILLYVTSMQLFLWSAVCVISYAPTAWDYGRPRPIDPSRSAAGCFWSLGC